MASNNFPVIVNGSTQWIAEAYYGDDNNLECICLKDPTTCEYLTAHSNGKHVYFTDNCDSWESWYPYFVNSTNTKFIIKNLAHDTFIVPDEEDPDTWWQVWNEEESDDDFSGMVEFEGSIPMKGKSNTYQTNKNSDSEEEEEEEEVVVPTPKPEKRKYTKKADKEPKEKKTNKNSDSEEEEEEEEVVVPTPKPEKRKYTKKADKEPKEKKTKKKADVDPNKPKKELTVGMKAFQLYAKTMRPMVKEDNQGLSLGEMQKMIGDMWKALPDEEKQPFIDEVTNTASGTESD